MVSTQSQVSTNLAGKGSRGSEFEISRVSFGDPWRHGGGGRGGCGAAEQLRGSHQLESRATLDIPNYQWDRSGIILM